ncbi:MAG: type II toxin-antitoxin system prevent-host-death family antitoxin [Oscillospiraceae bacterium]|nr:type II toxin-antitoxin system prevent-host-death family antitoxin [Oscillospiraceae bacterium]
MIVSVTELEKDLERYVFLSQIEDILITQNGMIISKLSNPNRDRMEIAKSLVGILPDTMTIEEMQEERLSELGEDIDGR